MITAPLVTVTWEDAYSPDSTQVFNVQDVAALSPMLHITTVGYLLRDDANCVVTAAEACGDGVYRSLTVVRRAFVISVIPFRKTRKRKEDIRGIELSEHRI